MRWLAAFVGVVCAALATACTASVTGSLGRAASVPQSQPASTAGAEVAAVPPATDAAPTPTTTTIPQNSPATTSVLGEPQSSGNFGAPTPPDAPTGLQLSAASGQIALGWDALAADATAFLLVRSNAPSTWQPTDGSNYAPAQTIDEVTVLLAGTAHALVDGGRPNATMFYYRLFARDAAGLYSAASTQQGFAGGTKAWAGAATAVEALSTSAVRARVAVDRAGNAVVIFSAQTTSGANFSLYAADYRNGVGWQAPSLLEFDDNSHVHEPALAMDGDGNALVIWAQTLSGGVAYDGFYAYRPAGGVWSAPQAIGSAPVYDPVISVDAAGRFIAAWIGMHSYAATFTAGAGWSGATQLSAGAASQVGIGGNAAGRRVVAWTESDGTRLNTWAATLDHVGAAWSAPAALESLAGGDASYPQVALDDFGNATVAWSKSDGVRDNIWSNRMTADGSWGVAALREIADAGPAQYPVLAVRPSTGEVALSYQYSDGIADRCMVTLFSAAGGWTSAASIGVSGTGAATNAKLAFDGAGDITAVFAQSDGTRYNMRAARYDHQSAAWLPSQLLEADDVGHAVQVQVAIDRYGQATAVWEQDEGSGIRGIRANRYQ